MRCKKNLSEYQLRYEEFKNDINKEIKKSDAEINENKENIKKLLDLITDMKVTMENKGASYNSNTDQYSTDIDLLKLTVSEYYII